VTKKAKALKAKRAYGKKLRASRKAEKEAALAKKRAYGKKLRAKMKRLGVKRLIDAQGGRIVKKSRAITITRSNKAEISDLLHQALSLIDNL